MLVAVSGTEIVLQKLVLAPRAESQGNQISQTSFSGQTPQEAGRVVQKAHLTLPCRILGLTGEKKRLAVHVLIQGIFPGIHHMSDPLLGAANMAVPTKQLSL